MPSLMNIASASSTVILGCRSGHGPIAGPARGYREPTDITNGVPGAAEEMPLLGALFRGDGYQRAQQGSCSDAPPSPPYLLNPVSGPAA